MSKPPELRTLLTERLALEPLGPDNTAELAPLLEDPRVARTLSPTGLPPAPGLEPELIEAKVAHWRRYGFGLWLLRDRSTGAMVGRGGLQHTVIDGVDEIEIAWAIVPERWGEGLATELANLCVGLAFERLSALSVIAITLPDNIASRRVMEKCGMSFEREFVHVGLDHVLYRTGRPPSGST